MAAQIFLKLGEVGAESGMFGQGKSNDLFKVNTFLHWW